MRRALVTAGLIAAMLAAGGARALDHERRLTQFHHTAWTVAAGAPPDIWAIEQTPDGFLWLGTGAGLYRFDGIRFERVEPSGDAFLSNDIVSLLSLPSGDLWIGYQHGGVSRLRGGRLTNVTRGLPFGSIVQLDVDRGGAIWAVALDSGLGGSVARLDGDTWERIGPARGVPDAPIRGVAIDHGGTVWLAAPDRLLRMSFGQRRFERTDVAMVAKAKLFVGPGDRLWSSDPVDGTRVLPATGTTPAPSPEALTSQAQRLIFDRRGGLWATAQAGGLFRVAPAAVAAANGPLRARDLGDRFGLADGLSSNIAQPLREDREGNIWVGTNLGLDRFRASAVVTQAVVPVTSPLGYRAAFGQGGALYVADTDALRRVGPDGTVAVVARGLSRPRAICQSHDGTLWLANQQTLRRIGPRGIAVVAAPPEAAHSAILSCQEDRDGTLWLSVLGEGVFRRTAAGWSRFAIPGEPLPLSPYMIVADRQGRIWLAYLDRAVVLVEGDRVRRLSRAEGLDIGDLGIVAPRLGGGVLVGGDKGIARFEGTRFRSLRAGPGAPLDRIAGIIETARGETWLNGIAGIARVATRDLDAAFDRPGSLPRWQVFDFADGVPGLAQQDSYTPTAIDGPDGRIWFITNHGIAWIDPTALHRNPLPPPVVIRALRADGHDTAIAPGLKLAAGTSSLQIDYTALSLAVSERVRFRYRLDGVDTGWVDPGERRQAFYTKLGPGKYVFRVIAANNDGVWNTTGARLDFEILPTFVQTPTFIALVLILAAAVLWLLYSIRLRQMSVRIRARLEERLGERERIARELHDTLLQGFQGLMLRFQAATERIPPGEPARTMMEAALDQADTVLVEGRDSVRGLRTAAVRDLSATFVAVAAQAGDPAVKFEVVVEGHPRPLHPVVATEITRIGSEAIVNAFRHARAGRIDVHIGYPRNALALKIVDDGQGIDEAILEAGRKGHFGLTGMRERAALIRGEFSLSSRLGAGTEVALTVPARFAYANPRRRFAWPFGSGRVVRDRPAFRAS